MDNIESELLEELKGFLALYVNKILDDGPEEIINLAIKSRDKEIEELKKEIEELKRELYYLILKSNGGDYYTNYIGLNNNSNSSGSSFNSDQFNYYS